MTFSDDKEKSLAAGMNVFLSKPVNRTSLQETVSDALQICVTPL
jgi:CheY-like chemotaxis protein